jgi:hypothetical protein
MSYPKSGYMFSKLWQDGFTNFVDLNTVIKCEIPWVS